VTFANPYLKYEYGCSCYIGSDGSGSSNRAAADEGEAIKPMKLVFVAAVLGAIVV